MHCRSQYLNSDSHKLSSRTMGTGLGKLTTIALRDGMVTRYTEIHSDSGH